MPEETTKKFGTIVTDVGTMRTREAVLEGKKINLTTLAVGDGGGAYYEPLSEQTALVREVWRGEVLVCEKNPLSPNTLDIKGVIPSDAGGFVVRELGVFDKDGTMIGVCNTPDMEKMTFASGAGGKLDLIMHLLVTDADAVEVTVKPSLDTISMEDARKLVDDRLEELKPWVGAEVETAFGPLREALEAERQATNDALAALETKMAAAKEAAESAQDAANTAQSTADSALNRIVLGTSTLTAGSSSPYPDGTVYFMYT